MNFGTHLSSVRSSAVMLAAAFALSAGADAMAVPQFSVTVLSSPGALFHPSDSLGQTGWNTGNRGVNVFRQSRAVRWDSGGAVTDLIDPPDLRPTFGSTYASGVNRFGEVAGAGDLDGLGRRALRWANPSTVARLPDPSVTGSFSDLPSDVTVTETNATSIGLNGVAAGTASFSNDRTRAVLWRDSGPRILRMPTNVVGTDSVAYDTDVIGDVIGGHVRVGGARKPYMWRGFGSVPVACDFAGAIHGDVYSVSPKGIGVGTLDFGQFVSSSATRWGVDGSASVLADPVDLAGAGLVRRNAWGIEEYSNVVGDVRTGDGAQWAVLWNEQNVGHRLESLLQFADQGWRLTSAYSITSDNLGQLIQISAVGTNPAVNGGATTYVLLTSVVPEPSMVGLVMAPAIGMRRRRA